MITEGGKRFTKGAYCLGKIVYGKGWEELLTMLDFHQRNTKDSKTSHPTIDAYGSGEAFDSVSSLQSFSLANQAVRGCHEHGGKCPLGNLNML